MRQSHVRLLTQHKRMLWPAPDCTAIVRLRAARQEQSCLYNYVVEDLNNQNTSIAKTHTSAAPSALVASLPSCFKPLCNECRAISCCMSLWTYSYTLMSLPTVRPPGHMILGYSNV